MLFLILGFLFNQHNLFSNHEKYFSLKSFLLFVYATELDYKMVVFMSFVCLTTPPPPFYYPLLLSLYKLFTWNILPLYYLLSMLYNLLSFKASSPNDLFLVSLL